MAVLGGCSSGSGLLGSGSSNAQPAQAGSTVGLHDLIYGPPPVKDVSEAVEIECPRLDIRAGASTMVMTAPGGDGDPMQVRFQVSVARAARECSMQGNTLTMKVGVEGRVALGPAGEPGQTTVPLRLALVQEKLGSNKTLYGKLFLVPVTIPPGETAVNFTQVDNGVSATVNKDDLDELVVYIGFDPSSAPADKKRPAPKRARQTAGAAGQVR
jgi:hypothetical protein